MQRPDEGLNSTSFPRLWCCLSGRKRLLTWCGAWKEIALRPADIVVLPANAALVCRGQVGCWHRLRIYFDPKLLHVHHQRVRAGRHRCLGWYNTARPPSASCRHLFAALNAALAAEKDDLAKSVCASLLLAVECELRGEAASAIAVTGGQRLWSDALAYMRAHAYSPEFSRDDLAAHFDLHPNHLSRLFSHHGECYQDALTRIRMEKARHLLIATDWRILDIAGSCGFADTDYFARVFRRRHGVSPSAWRQTTQRDIPLDQRAGRSHA